jgi:hypothetical protein
MTGCRGVEVKLHTMFGSKRRRMVSCIPGKEPSTHCIEGCVGSRAGLDVLEQKKITYIGRESKNRNESPEDRVVIMGKCMRV